MVPMEKIDEETSFSPLLWTLQVMLNMYDYVRDYRIDFIEFALCVQTSNPLSNIADVCNRIISIREERKKTEDKDAYDDELIHNEWTHYCKEEGNFREYADTNIRYLKTTGVIKDSGNGITIDPQYLSLVKAISKNSLSNKTLKERYIDLCNGSPLFISYDGND